MYEASESSEPLRECIAQQMEANDKVTRTN